MYSADWPQWRLHGLQKRKWAPKLRVLCATIAHMKEIIKACLVFYSLFVYEELEKGTENHQNLKTV